MPDLDPSTAKEPRLLDLVRTRLRTKRYSPRTEQAYVGWIRRYIRLHNLKHPREMGTAQVDAFLTYFALERDAAASTQNQALAALLFLHEQVLRNRLGPMEAVRARRPTSLPTVLSPDEVRTVLAHMTGPTAIKPLHI